MNCHKAAYWRQGFDTAYEPGSQLVNLYAPATNGVPKGTPNLGKNDVLRTTGFEKVLGAFVERGEQWMMKAEWWMKKFFSGNFMQLCWCSSKTSSGSRLIIKFVIIQIQTMPSLTFITDETNNRRLFK